MSLKDFKSFLGLTLAKLREAENLNPIEPNQIVDLFRSSRGMFASMLQNQSPQYAKLSCLTYDRLVIDFLLKSKITFPLSEISLEDALHGTAGSVSEFIKDVQQATKVPADLDLLEGRLTVAFFVLSTDNAKEIVSIRRELRQQYRPPQLVEEVKRDVIYNVRVTLPPRITQLQWLVLLVFIVSAAICRATILNICRGAS